MKRKSQELDANMIGKIVSAVVTAVGNAEIELQLVSKPKQHAVLPYYLISDTPAHADVIKQSVKPGYIFDRLLVLEIRSSKIILSSKYSLIEAAKSLPHSVSQLVSQQVIQGYVSEIHEKSCFVKFLGTLRGVVLVKDASDNYTKDFSKAYQVGQSVRCHVLQVDYENNKFLLSMKQSLCISTNASMLEGYFLEEEQIATLKGAEVSWPTHFQIGVLVEAEVQDIKDYGIIFSFRNNGDVVGFATHYQCEGQLVVGATVKAVVLDIVKADGIVDLSLKKRMVANSSKRFPKVLERVEVVVELVKEEYLVLSMPQYENAIGFASSRDYNMRVLRPHDYYQPGQRMIATVHTKNLVNGRVLLLIVDELSVPKPITLSTKAVKIGAVADGKILEVNAAQLHMVVEIGRGLRGKVHITETQVDNESAIWNPLERFSVGQSVKVRVLSKQKGSRKKKEPIRLDLSLRLSENPEIITFETIKTGQEIIGYVQDVNDEWAWIVVAPHTRGRLYILQSSDNISELESFKRRFKVGDGIKCHVIRVNHKDRILDLSARPLRWNSDVSVQEGDVLPGRISKVLDGIGSLTIQLGPGTYGRVHITHLGDVWQSNPAALFSIGKFVRCRVLEVYSLHGKTTINLSLRASLGGAGGLDTPLHGNTSCGRIVDSVKELKNDMVVQGFVKNVTEKGCFVTLAPKLDARVLLKNLAENYLENPAESFPVGMLVNGRVLSVDPLSGRVDLTLVSKSNE